MNEKIVNLQPSYTFKNRVLRFNERYYFELGEDKIDESYFAPIAAAWDEIRSECPKDMKFTDLTDAHFEKMKKASEEVYEKLRQLALDKGLCGAYIVKP